ncbi:MAG: CpXC domain-containing protein [Nitrospirota bacterium]
MLKLLAKLAEAYSTENFRCHNCSQDFSARVITWVDVTKAPQAKQALFKWEFNIIQCVHCGYQHFSNTPFFYEDFEEGLLIAVFPVIPEKRAEMEQAIREKYDYYPLLEFFYDMTQIWMLVYFQEQYKTNKNLRALSRFRRKEERLRKILHFLKENTLMIEIRKKLSESVLGYTTNDELDEILDQALYTLEEMLPWPLDARCLCGADLKSEFICCEEPISLKEHGSRLSRHYVIYCNTCKQSFSGASCEKCGKAYTWKLGTIPTYIQDMPRMKRILSRSVQKSATRW